MSEKKPEVLVACLDGSAAAEKAFERALSIKRPDDTLYICHSVERLRVDDFAMVTDLTTVTAPDPKVYDEANERLVAAAKEMVSHYAKACEEKNVTNVKTGVLVSDNPKEGVVEFCKQHKADMCVVGSRGLGAVQRFILGSFSNYLVNHCESNVMVVKHNE